MMQAAYQVVPSFFVRVGPQFFPHFDGQDGIRSKSFAFLFFVEDLQRFLEGCAGGFLKSK